MNNIEIYPWQHETWKHLSNLHARSGLPHALLMRGRSGIGKFDFALALTQSLLCETPLANGYACCSCASCGYFAQSNHPDYRLLAPEQEAAGADDETPAAQVGKTGKKSQISVAQIRELGSFLELTSHRNDGLRIVLIHPAEALNMSSANALLKMLEEPPPRVIFILVSHQPQRLLPTIMSRCQKIDMPVPTADIALRWLNGKGVKDAQRWLDYTGGSLLAALSDVEGEGGKSPSDLGQILSRGARLDPFISAPLCVAKGMNDAIQALQKWVYDLVSCQLTGQVRYHSQYLSVLQDLTKSVDLRQILDFQRKLDEARKSASHPLNNELQLESLLLQYTQLFL